MAKLINDGDEKIILEGVHSELYASHLYRHLANQLQRLGYPGAQKFFLGEASGELEHYQRHVEFLNDMGGCAAVPAIEAMDEPVSGLREAIQTAFDTEVQLLSDYEAAYRRGSGMAIKQHLLAFIEIQVKSAGEFGDLLARLDRAGDNPAALLLIDQEMGAQ